MVANGIGTYEMGHPMYPIVDWSNIPLTVFLFMMQAFVMAGLHYMAATLINMLPRNKKWEKSNFNCFFIYEIAFFYFSTHDNHFIRTIQIVFLLSLDINEHFQIDRAKGAYGQKLSLYYLWEVLEDSALSD